LQTTIAQLEIGEKAIIRDFDINFVPLKLIEMGCLPGNTVQLLQVAPFGDPLFLDINLAIRLETASMIEVDIIKE